MLSFIIILFFSIPCHLLTRYLNQTILMITCLVCLRLFGRSVSFSNPSPYHTLLLIARSLAGHLRLILLKGICIIRLISFFSLFLEGFYHSLFLEVSPRELHFEMQLLGLFIF